MPSTIHRRQASHYTKNIVAFLNDTIGELPPGYFDSFRYTTTGNNLAHSILWGLLAKALGKLSDVSYVGIDVRLNKGGTKFQPDLVALSSDNTHLLYVDCESPNSCDARIPWKDVDAYNLWSNASETRVPYLIVTCLPNAEAPNWELRYTAKGYYNEAFHNRRDEIRANPYRFWYAYYASELARQNMTGVALINIDVRRARHVWLERWTDRK